MAADKRRFTRFEYPTEREPSSKALLVSLPELSDDLLRPENFSTGGFKVNLPRCPRIGDKATCSIHLYDVTLSGLSSSVVHIIENRSDPPTWSIGVSIDIDDGERDHLSSLLTAFINEEEEVA